MNFYITAWFYGALAIYYIYGVLKAEPPLYGLRQSEQNPNELEIEMADCAVKSFFNEQNTLQQFNYDTRPMQIRVGHPRG